MRSTLSYSPRFWLSLALVIIWMIAMGFAFWWFQLRWYQPLEDLTGDALFDSTRLQASQTRPDAALEIVHFYDGNCPCTRFNTPHVQALSQQYRSDDVRLRVLVPSADQLDKVRQLFPHAEHAVATPQNAPPASPSALVISRELGAQYLGPWSPGAVCNARSGDYVAQVLDQLLTGKRHEQTFQLARGCLCPWPNRLSLAQAGVFQ
ncbi:hypothetical protein CLV44_102124 [Marinobacterium halophilum]|uniref:DUF6436 domain-containing protein n=1 Tax=Marinobacterium halophilum TaxID=267374 RepID=A0A2P8F3B2_9GAMM|nr:DUF6436 domain-containing protein [Marinobacterium halophilum]PSL16201.1 hypothetical protein CLV44_102124 [Marinobacterium halophilum]